MSKGVYTLKGDAKDTATYSCENLDLLELDFQRYGYDVLLDDCTMEKIKIKNGDIESDGYIVDLGENNGYFLIGNNYKIYDMSLIKGFNLNSNSIEKLIYDIELGYNFDKKEFIDDNLELEPLNSSFLGTTDSGVITESLLYIQDRYGTDYYLNSSKINYLTSSFTMSEGSVYLRDTMYTEGNCGLIGPYNFLVDLKHKESLSKLPSTNDLVEYEPYFMENSIYLDRVNQGNYSIFSGNTSKSFSSLYINSRLSAIEISGDIESISFSNSKRILENVAYSNGYTSSQIKFVSTSLPSFTNIRNHFDAEETIVFSVWGHSVYGNHTMFSTGYEVFRADREFLGIPYVDYKYMLILRNGWQNYNTYFDFSVFFGRSGMITANVDVGSC